MTRETAPRFAGIGGQQSHKAGTVDWLTPKFVIDETGPYDLDPCAPEVQPFATAVTTFTRRDNGLLKPWHGRVWLNPPYTPAEIKRWLARMAAHGNGTALIFARTDTEAFHRYVFEHATALLFMRGRINFLQLDGKPALRRDGTEQNAGAPTVLCAYGVRDADVLAGCSIAGKFVPLRIPRSIAVSFFSANKSGEKIDTWSELLAEFMAGRGPVDLDQIYRAFSGHPKAAANSNFDAKLRQQLQRGSYRKVRRGVWEAAS